MTSLAIMPVIAVAFPFVLACGMLVRPLGRAVARIGWSSSLPALAVAIGARDSEPVEIGALLFGMRVGSDPLGRAFLLPTAVLWLAAGWFARTYLARSERRDSFWFFFLLTSSGNMGVLLAQDVVTFYVAYAVMTFAAYGLILHERTEEARRAGRVYLAMSIGAEAALLVALWMIVGARIDLPLSEASLGAARTPYRDIATLLLFVGFGVKAGAVPLHLWLPLAHPIAPVPASAILSGALIKAGLFGWLRFLPLGVMALPAHGALWTAVGLLSVLYAAVVGALQREPKVVLAYSSISQMGFMLIPLGVALAFPSSAGIATFAVVVFAQQHAIAKGALFLGTAVAPRVVGKRPRRFALAGLVLCALAIAGAPWSSGALAKLAVKDAIRVSPHAGLLGAALSIGSVGSTLLMVRFVIEAAPRNEPCSSTTVRPGLWLPWAMLVVGAIGYPVYARSLLIPTGAFPDPHSLWASAWPVGAGVLVAYAASFAVRRGAVLPTVAPGDALVPLERAVRRVRAIRPFESVKRCRPAYPALRDGKATRAWRTLEREGVRLGRRGLRAIRSFEAAEASLTKIPSIGVAALVVMASMAVMECGARTQ